MCNLYTQGVRMLRGLRIIGVQIWREDPVPALKTEYTRAMFHPLVQIQGDAGIIASLHDSFRFLSN